MACIENTGYNGKMSCLGQKITLILVFISLSACSLISEDLTQAKKLVSEKKYKEAIQLLDTYKSGTSKKYNAVVNIEYGISKLKNLEAPKSERYPEAKANFERALSLDPKNTEARTFYIMMVKLINQHKLDVKAPEPELAEENTEA